MANVKRSVTPIVALDVPTEAAATKLVDDLGDLCRFYKIGGELFTAAGPSVVKAVRERGASVFLDLKFHDIPNTVKGSVKSAARMGVRILTVHASGGRSMLEAAVAGAAEAGAADCEIFAVTALTSLDERSLTDVWGRPVTDVRAEVLRLASLAAQAGVAGVVCSGQEAAAVRDAHRGKLATLVPGVRLALADRHDQSRVVSPAEAAAAGAKYIVVGRPVTAAQSPRDAMLTILSDLP